MVLVQPSTWFKTSRPLPNQSNKSKNIFIKYFLLNKIQIFMKAVRNPTQYFFEQSNNPPTEYLDKINEFVGKLINLKQCILCKCDYNLKDRIPRILIHCGHTICQSCLSNFYKNRRVRCPLCLKLIKHLDSIERLPINHTIFTKIAEEINNKSKLHGNEQYIKCVFRRYGGVGPISALQAQKTKQQHQPGMPLVDPDSGLEFCEFHNDRVKHFFCMKHKGTCCRVCSEMMHQKKDCIVVDLYEIEDVPQFLQEAYKLGEDGQPGNEQGKKKEDLFGQGFLHDAAICCKQNDEDNKFNDDDLDDDFEDNSLKSV